MVKRGAERLESREVFNYGILGTRLPAHEWLVDPKIMAVAMHQDDRPAESHGLFGQCRTELRKPVWLLFGISGKRGEIRKNVG